jgi:hypothetical protein
MKNPFKKSLVFIFSLSLLASSCGIGSNKSEKIKESSEKESSLIEEPKVSSRGKVLCFERAQKEKNAFLAEVAYDKCLETIDENLAKFDEEQADLYFLDKKDIDKKTNNAKKAKKKKKKKKNSKIVKTKKENSCKEGTIAGGAIGAGIGLAASRGKDKFWAVPAAGTIGALVGCQVDGG